MRETRNEARRRRHQRVRQKIAGTENIPRLSVFRSLKHIYAQIIDDDAGKTLVSASTLDADVRSEVIGQSKTDQPAPVGRHEVDRLGRGHLGGDHKVTLVLAILVVDKDEHPAVAGIVEDAGRLTGIDLLQRISQGHVSVAMMMAECFPVGGDIHQLRILTVFRKSAQ